MESKKGHPLEPTSNVRKFAGFNPDDYDLIEASNTVRTDNTLNPGKPPALTDHASGWYLRANKKELIAVPPTACIDELPDAVIDNMVKRDKAFWVDSPGVNAYNLHDAYTRYGMTTVKVAPHHQDPFPRSYEYEWVNVTKRRRHACDGLKTGKKELPAQCRDCNHLDIPGFTPFQQAWVPDPAQKRWRTYPDVSAQMSYDEINKKLMYQVGRPFKNEAIAFYNKNFPATKFDLIFRRFGK